MNKRSVMVTVASPSLVLQATAPAPGPPREDRPELGRVLQEAKGCSKVESTGGTTGNQVYAWFDEDDDLLKWYGEQWSERLDSTVD